MVLNLFFILLLMILFIVLSIAFITLFERHILSLSQNRVGPMKVFFLGVVQAGLDGVKLMSKEQILPFLSFDMFFLFVPGLSFVFMLVEWFCLPFYFFFINFQYSFLFLLNLVGVSVYFTIISGLLSNSKYSFLGSIRSSSQSVSFEIMMTFLFFIFMFLFCSLSINYIFNLILFFILILFLFMIIAELNRAPFDFSEGESELVSGFNTEHSSVSFIFLFLGEYGVLIFFSCLMSLLFFNFNFFSFVFFFSLILFIRSVYPRYRYDKLMNFFWKFILPMVIFFFFFFYLIIYF